MSYAGGSSSFDSSESDSGLSVFIIVLIIIGSLVGVGFLIAFVKVCIESVRGDHHSHRWQQRVVLDFSRTNPTCVLPGQTNPVYVNSGQSNDTGFNEDITNSNRPPSASESGHRVSNTPRLASEIENVHIYETISEAVGADASSSSCKGVPELVIHISIHISQRPAFPASTAREGYQVSITDDSQRLPHPLPPEGPEATQDPVTAISQKSSYSHPPGARGDAAEPGRDSSRKLPNSHPPKEPKGPELERDISQRPPYPLPLESSKENNAIIPYRHYDTPYDFRIFRTGVPVVQWPERFRRKLPREELQRNSLRLKEPGTKP